MADRVLLFFTKGGKCSEWTTRGGMESVDLSRGGLPRVRNMNFNPAPRCIDFAINASYADPCPLIHPGYLNSGFDIGLSGISGARGGIRTFFGHAELQIGHKPAYKRNNDQPSSETSNDNVALRLQRLRVSLPRLKANQKLVVFVLTALSFGLFAFFQLNRIWKQNAATSLWDVGLFAVVFLVGQRGLFTFLRSEYLLILALETPRYAIRAARWGCCGPRAAVIAFDLQMSIAARPRLSYACYAAFVNRWTAR